MHSLKHFDLVETENMVAVHLVEHFAVLDNFEIVVANYEKAVYCDSQDDLKTVAGDYMAEDAVYSDSQRNLSFDFALDIALASFDTHYFGLHITFGSDFAVSLKFHHY